MTSTDASVSVNYATTPDEESLSARVAEHVASTNIESLPESVVEGGKMYVLDTLASGIAGGSTHVVETLARQVQRWGGRAEATVWGTGLFVPAPHAAFVNASGVHGLDLDAVHDDATIHAYTCVVPAALATGQESHASGADFLSGVIAGADVAVRLGRALGVYRGFILTSICGGFGAASAAGRALRLDRDGVLRTLGIQYGQTSGNRQTFLDGGSSTRFQPGFQAQAGVTSAYLAQAGLSGARLIFEGAAGFLTLYCETGEANADALTDELGHRYYGAEVSVKPFPSCRGTHGAIEATLDLVNEHAVPADSIDRIVVHVPKNETGIFNLIGAPFAPGPDPHVDAQYSIPYTVAASALHRRFFIAELEQSAILDPVALDLADRVDVVVDLEAAHGKALMPVRVEIVKTDGSTVSTEVTKVKGHPERPFSWDDVVAKFTEAIEPHAGLRERGSDVVALVERLDTVGDVSELAELLTVGS